MKYQIFHQKDLQPWLPILTEWRLREYRPFPYLYDGNYDMENAFSLDFASIRNAVLVLAIDDNEQLAGFCTGVPLAEDKTSHGVSKAQNFHVHGYDPKQWFYITDVVVHEHMRSQGIGTQLMLRMRHEHEHMGYPYSCFLCVRREDVHPLRPIGYTSPELIWSSLGYRKLGFETTLEWQTFQPEGGSANISNPMEYWGNKE